MKLRTILLSFFSIFSIGLISQTEYYNIEWQDHLPYHHTISVATANHLVYCATPYSLFYLDKNTNQINRLSKINGLSDFGISCIDYNEAANTLLIAYTNANIDLIKNNTIINIPDIKQAQNLLNKTINNIYFSDSLSYLACGFGIVVVDIYGEGIQQTYYIGDDGAQINVLDVTIGME